MRNLNMLVIESNQSIEKNSNKFDPVSEQAYTAIQLFMHFLPKTVFDGASKLNICFKERPEDRPKYFYDDYFHISIYYIENEVIKKCRYVSIEEKDEFYLHVIENVLIDISSRTDRKEELIQIIKETAQKVRSVNFELQIKISKLSKYSKDRKYKAITYRKLSSSGELDYVEIIDKEKNIFTYNITDGYVAFPLDYQISKCEWNNYVFNMKHSLGSIMAYINAENHTMYSVASQNTTFVSKIINSSN